PTHYYVGCLPSHLISFRRVKIHPPSSQTSGQLNLFIQMAGRLACPKTPRDRPMRTAALAQASAPFRQPSFVTPQKCKPGRIRFATSTAPRLPLADLVSNPTPPGQITRERASRVHDQLGRE